ncbi:ATP-binding cassette domain-containing protein [Rheinheimera tilapiae]|uniref:ATP-binding cassette domain-containing protein n=1 Tax=Rheinheimera tilapiae TaxID=875043 RepID=A0ABV6BEV5_9GAMM
MKQPTHRQIRLRDLWLAHKAGWSLSFSLGVLTVFATVALLAWSGWFISAAAAAGVGASFNYLRPGALIRLFAIMRTAGRYGERVLSHALVLRLLAVLRVQVFVSLAHQNGAQQTGHSVLAGGDRLQRLIADIDVLDQLPLRLLNPLGYASLLSAAFLLLLLFMLPGAFWPVFGVLLLLALAIVVVSRQGARGPVQQAATEVQLQGQRRGLLLENLQLLTTLLTTGHWQQREQQFIRLDQQVLHLQQNQQYGQLAAQLLLQCLMLAGLAALCWPMLAALLAEQPFPLEVPLWLGLVLAWLGLSELLFPLLLLPQSYGQLRAAQQRCNALATPVCSSPDLAAAEPSDLCQGVTLDIRQLQFGFQQPLGEVSASFQQGDVVLLKGPSGSGKSCLLQTLAAEIPALTGSILLQGLTLEQWPTAARYQQLGYLPQRPYLFGLSVAADLRLAKPAASDEELLQVLTLVGLDDWLARQSQGLLTVLGDYGVGLSGGELKRFALARLLLQKPAVLLLDEPFAGLQQQLAQQLLQRLAAFQQHGMLIIASHQQQQDKVFNQTLCL